MVSPGMNKSSLISRPSGGVIRWPPDGTTGMIRNASSMQACRYLSLDKALASGSGFSWKKASSSSWSVLATSGRVASSTKRHESAAATVSLRICVSSHEHLRVSCDPPTFLRW